MKTKTKDEEIAELIRRVVELENEVRIQEEEKQELRDQIDQLIEENDRLHDGFYESN